MKKLTTLLVLTCIIFANSTAMAKGSEEKKSKGKGRAVVSENAADETPAEVKGRGQEHKAKNVRRKRADSDKKASAASPHAKQLAVFKKQLAHEQEKHYDRIAKLKRIGELDKKQGDGKFAAKIKELTTKEQMRYARKTAMVKMRIRMAENAVAKQQSGEKSKIEASKENKSDVGKENKRQAGKNRKAKREKAKKHDDDDDDEDDDDK